MVLEAERPRGGFIAWLQRAGRAGWAFVGAVAGLLVIGYVASRLTVLIIPVIVALFPATVLSPVSTRLKRRGWPPALAALATVLGATLLVGGILGALVPVFAAQAPEVIDAARVGISDLREAAEQTFGVDLPDLSEFVPQSGDQGLDNGEIAQQAIGATGAVIRTLTAVVLLFVALFFYLKDDVRLVQGALSVLPSHLRGHGTAIAERAWSTLGAYFRGQLVIALVDAVFIGIGLLIVGVPLVLPLSVLIFFGGFIPIVGAVTTGALAVLVALADQGLSAAFIVLAINVGVQQVESNVLEPVIMSRAIQLHPFIVLLAVSAGALLMGIVGAFLAVPIAGVVDQVRQYVQAQGDTTS